MTFEEGMLGEGKGVGGVFPQWWFLLESQWLRKDNILIN